MRTKAVIAKKKNGQRLKKEEIDFMVQGYVGEKVPDYQMAAFLMAVCLQGLDDEETTWLTESMVSSGRTLNLSKISGPVVDKHSTGGVGDSATLVLAPWVAAAGAVVAKMSGRGLGHTGGTLDKLESIPGFRVDLSEEELIEQVNHIGVAVVSATADLAPADKKIYGLRDVTATVSSPALIASSVMSKKIAAGAQAIVLDVKVGSGAFMKTLEEARKLAKIMVSIGERLGRKTVAVLSSMDQPLGFAVGNSLEVKEAIDVLKGEGPDDLTELCLELGSQMLVLGRVAETTSCARQVLLDVQAKGKALDKFGELVRAQGGEGRVIEVPEKVLSQAAVGGRFCTERDGYIEVMDTEKIGRAAMELGAGRKTKEDCIDFSAGLVFERKVGDLVKSGETVAHLYTSDKNYLAPALSLLQAAIVVQDEKPSSRPLILDFLSEKDVWI